MATTANAPVCESSSLPPDDQAPEMLMRWGRSKAGHKALKKHNPVDGANWVEGGCVDFAGAIMMLYPDATVWQAKFAKPDRAMHYHLFVNLGGQSFDGAGPLCKEGALAAVPSAFLKREGLDKDGYVDHGFASFTVDPNVLEEQRPYRAAFREDLKKGVSALWAYSQNPNAEGIAISNDLLVEEGSAVKTKPLPVKAARPSRRGILPTPAETPIFADPFDRPAVKAPVSEDQIGLGFILDEPPQPKESAPALAAPGVDVAGS